jgi:UDP-glucuronate decarboxylase
MILVTGGAGFIGSHLCDRLYEEGHEITCLDNFFTGRLENIHQLMGNHRFELIRHDVTQPIRIDAKQIFNLACPASPVHYQVNPIQTIKTSIVGTLHMLELAQETGARVLQASTSEVYGDPSVHPQPEDYWGYVNPIGPRSCYNEGKRAAETLMMDFHRQKGVDIRIARIFNTFGPRMAVDDGRVISNFIVQALRDEDLTIYGQGDQTRSFCYISDMIDGLVRMMAAENVTGPVNLGNTEEISILDLARLILKLTRSKSGIVHEPLPVDDPVHRRPDVARACAELGWNPRVSLEEGLLDTIAYFRTILA